jgi:hypothetical protein
MRITDKRKHGLLFLALLTSGCATMSAEDCSTADWRLIGLADGSQGQLLSKGDRRGSDCAKHGVAMDRSRYEAGRDEGLAGYCVEGTAYQIGERGQSYNGVCAAHNEADFLAAYEKGLELHAFKAAASSASSQLASARARHEDLDDQLEKYWGGYREEELSAEEHNTMVLELWSERKYLASKAILYWLDADRALTEALNDYRSKVAANDPSIGSQLRPPAYTGPEPWDGPTQEEARAMLEEVFNTLARAGNGSD